MKRKKNSRVDGLTLFNIWYSWIYLLIPGILSYDSFYIPEIYKRYQNFRENSLANYIAFLVIVVFYIIFILAYLTLKKKKISNKISISKKDINIRKICPILLIISVLGFFLFTSGYGGVMNTYKNINTIRSGVYERNTFSAIARMFINYSVVSMLFSYVYLKKNRFKLSIFMIFLLSFIFSMIFLLFSGGRAGLLFPIIQLIILKILLNKEFKVNINLLLICIGVFIIMIYGKEIMANLNKGSDYIVKSLIVEGWQMKNVFKNFVKNFVHPYYSLIIAINKIGIEENPIYFLNPLYTVKFFLKLFGFSYHGTISHLNTELILGIYDSNIPPGIIALSYYNFLYPGVLIGAIFYALILVIIEKYFKRLKNNIYGLVFYSMTIDIFAQYIWNGDIRVLIMQRIMIIILMIFILFKNTKLIERGSD
ncbi:O-antigen polymerase (plasmid) [Cetobacterium somerae]